MQHPIIAGSLVAGYLAGMAAWIHLIGGITWPRRGSRLQCAADVVVTIAWPLAATVTFILHLRESRR